MDKFRIGQKVRVVKSDNFPQAIGEVTTIQSVRQFFDNGHNKWFGYTIDLPHMWLGPAKAYCELCPKEEHLEPAYDGDEKGSWDALAGIWSPLVIVTKEKQSG
ncbi:MAG TPA: hypothetical protein VIM16_05835 [Mucilaginibacter sp.]|jgi:hypothetical protein